MRNSFATLACVVLVATGACDDETTAGDDDGTTSTAAAPGSGGSGAVGGEGGAIGGGGSGGCEADVDSDPSNCGACGQDCLGGACQAGRCQPVQLHDDFFYGPLATDGSHVYWFDDGLAELWRVPTGGGAAASVADLGAEDVSSVSDLVATAGGVVVSAQTSTDNVLLRIDPTSGDVEPLFANGGDANGWPGTFAADDSYAYVVEYEFYRVPLVGGPPEPLTTGSELSQYYRFGMALDADRVYIRASGYSSQGPKVFHVAKTGGLEATIEPLDVDAISGLASGILTVVRSGNDECGATSTFQTVVPGGAPNPIAGVSGVTEVGVADADHTYFRNYCDDALYRLPLAGGTAELLYDGLYDGGITADATAVYFWGAGGLARLAK